MKSTLAVLLFLLTPLSSSALQLSGEWGFYRVKLKGDYRREVGLDKWKGRKGGYYYSLKLEDLFPITSGSDFKLSVVTGTTKVPYVNIFTSNSDSLFQGGVKTFNLRELYFEKRKFLFKRLKLRVGKQPFRVPGLFKDYLWGGKFVYSFDSFSLFWDQIAGYEGRYLLPTKGSEDDVDIAVFGLKRGGLTVGLYRIMDARGELPARFKSGFFLGLNGKGYSLSLVSQSGKVGGWGELRHGFFELKGGYWQKGITSYGYSEDVRGEGILFRPDTDGLLFGKVSSSFTVLKLPVTLYAARFETSSGKLIGNELGGEVDYPAGGGELFLKGAVGSRNSYAFFGGYRWGVKFPSTVYPSLNVKLKSYFDVVGEYADFPKKDYSAQLDYEGWAKYSHVGYWHSTYSLTAFTDSLRLKVSTGRNSKVNYVVWGNTADNFLYQRNHRKLWHLEEALFKEKGFIVGLQPFSVKPLISDYLPGVSFQFKGLKFGTFYNRFSGGRGNDDHGLWAVSYRGLSYVLVSNGSSTQSALSFYFERNGLSLGAVREWGYGHSGDWGGVLGLKGELLEWSLSGSYRVFSNFLSTFNLREFYRNSGLALRPGERGVRYLSFKAEEPFNHFGLSRFSTRLKLIYNRLYRFSGDYVAQELGLGFLLKTGRNSYLELLGALGSSSISYTSLRFSVSW